MLKSDTQAAIAPSPSQSSRGSLVAAKALSSSPPRWLLRVALGCMLSAASVLVRAGEADGLRVVESSGEGATVYEAQQDAIRRALQQVVPQIVVADRTIENDEVKLDRVMSSMNGFIQGVQMLDQRRANDSVSVRVRVSISTAEIENFVGNSAAGTSKVSGRVLVAESNRAQESRVFRSRFMARFFMGYPYQAIEATVASMQPSPADPGMLRMTVTYQLNPTFIDAVYHAAEVLSCPAQDVGSVRCSPQQICAEGATRIVLGVHLQGAMRCTVLAAAAGADGRYKILDALRIAGRLGFVARFVNSDGARVAEHRNCFDWSSIRYMNSDSHGGEWRTTDPISLEYGMVGSRRIERYTLSSTALAHTFELPVAYLQKLVPLSKVEGVKLTAILGEGVLIGQWRDMNTVPVMVRFELPSISTALLVFNARSAGAYSQEFFAGINDGPDITMSDDDRARNLKDLELLAPKRFASEACLWR